MPAAGEVFQYTFVQTYQGQTLENVMHMRAIAAGLPSAADLTASANNWLSTQKIIQVDAVIYRSVRIKQMTPIAFDEQIIAPSVAGGEISIAGHNTTVSVVVTKRTGVAGRSHRGRLYFGGFPLAWGTDVNSVGSGPAVMASFCNAILAKFKEGGTDPTMVAGVYSRTIGGSFPFTVAGWQPITRYDPQPIFGNQRRRRISVGI
jgi:hypothetical protein